MEKDEIKLLLDKVRFYNPSEVDRILKEEIEVSKAVDEGKYPKLEQFKKYMVRRNVSFAYKLYGTLDGKFAFSDSISLFILNEPLIVTRLLIENAQRRGTYIQEGTSVLEGVLEKLRSEKEYMEAILKSRDKDKTMYENSEYGFSNESVSDINRILGRKHDLQLTRSGIYLHSNSDAGEGYVIGRRVHG